MNENALRLHPNMDRLNNLRDLEVADDSPDVRGWDVSTMSEHDIGRVEDLVVDTRNMTTRYLLVDVNTSNDRAGRSGAKHGQCVLVPVDRALAGHRDLATTQRYMHLSPNAVNDAIRLLEMHGHKSHHIASGDIVETAIQ